MIAIGVVTVLVVSILFSLFTAIKNIWRMPSREDYRTILQKSYVLGQAYAYRRAHDVCLARSKEALVAQMPAVLVAELESRAAEFLAVAETVERSGIST